MKNSKMTIFLLLLMLLFNSCGLVTKLTEDEFNSEKFSHNANLSTLMVSPYNVISFSKDNTSYNVIVPSNISAIAVAASAEHEKGSLKINGGQASNNTYTIVDVSELSTGQSKIITVEVTAEYEKEKKTYTITATKSASALSISEDFETGNFNKYGWIRGNYVTQPWYSAGPAPYIQANEKYQGTYAAFVQTNYLYQVSYFRIFIANSSNLTLSFYQKYNTYCYTYRFIIDGVTRISSISSSWGSSGNFTLTPGNHTIEWLADTYSWSNTGSVTIDNIVIQ